MRCPFSKGGRWTNLSSNFIHDNHSWERMDLAREIMLVCTHVHNSLLYIIKHCLKIGHTRLDRDSKVVRHDNRLEHAWCRYSKSNSLQRGEEEEEIRSTIMAWPLLDFLLWRLWSATVNNCVHNQTLDHLPLVKARFTLIDLALIRGQKVRWTHSIVCCEQAMWCIL